MSLTTLDTLNDMKETLEYYSNECSETLQKIGEFSEALQGLPYWEAITQRQDELQRLYRSAGAYVDQIIQSEMDKLLLDTGQSGTSQMEDDPMADVMATIRAKIEEASQHLEANEVVTVQIAVSDTSPSTSKKTQKITLH